jgi:hypothetical protein
MLQFHALDCVDLSTPADSSTEQNHVLRVDTVVDCESTAYKNFVLANCLLIVIYQSVPLVWFCFLWRVRHLLNPMAYDGAINLRKPTTPEIEHDSSSSHGDNEDPVKSGHESISQFVERLSQSKGMRQSAGELRSSHQARRASAHHKTKKLADEEYVVKVSLKIKELLIEVIAFESIGKSFTTVGLDDEVKYKENSFVHFHTQIRLCPVIRT